MFLGHARTNRSAYTGTDSRAHRRTNGSADPGAGANA